MTRPEAPAKRQRLTTGVPGLDEILNGGLLEGGVYILRGPPGAGKTILGNQIAFAQAAAGASVVYVTLLAESHARLLTHMQDMAFFDEERLAQNLHYVSGYHALEDGGLAGLLDLLRKEMRDRHATFVVLDGLVSAEAFAETALAVKKFVHELQTFIALVGATGLLLTSGSDRALGDPELTMVDGLFDLSNRVEGARQRRGLFVRKFRGSRHLGGRHDFMIDDGGVRIFPRIESRVTARQLAPHDPPGRVATGIAGLDDMLHGGLRRGGTTLVYGPPGAGKTLLGLHFLHAGLRAGERCLYFGFNEAPGALVSVAAAVGLDLWPHVESGALKVLWTPSVDHLADDLAERAVSAAREMEASRLVIDSLEGFRRSLLVKERTGAFLEALIHELSAGRATSMLLDDDDRPFSSPLHARRVGVVSFVDNAMFVRQVELEGELRRVCAFTKTRGERHDAAIRFFSIGARGVAIGDVVDGGVEAALTGTARRRTHGQTGDAAVGMSRRTVTNKGRGAR